MRPRLCPGPRRRLLPAATRDAAARRAGAAGAAERRPARHLRRPQRPRHLALGPALRLGLGPGVELGGRLAALLLRPVAVHELRLDLGQRRELGLGAVPLRPLVLAEPARLGLGPGLPMGPGVGVVARRRRLRRLGADGPVGHQHRVPRVLDLRPPPAHLPAARAHRGRPAAGQPDDLEPDGHHPEPDPRAGLVGHGRGLQRRPASRERAGLDRPRPAAARHQSDPERTAAPGAGRPHRDASRRAARRAA